MANTDAAADAAVASIEQLTPAVVDAVLPLSREAGWNQVAADWYFMLTHGRGIGVRGSDGHWIASALVLPLGVRVAWISMVLVTARERQRGIGRALLRGCFDDADAHGALAGLDATELGRPVYLRHGFHDCYALRRWRVPGWAAAPCAAPKGIQLRVMRATDMAALQVFDRARSGFDRVQVLAELASRKPAMATIAETDDGTICGYALARDGRLATQIGPVAADGPGLALALMTFAMRAGTPPYILDVPDQHQAINRWLEANGAVAQRAFIRMVRGDGADLPEPSHIFALAGPELT